MLHLTVLSASYWLVFHYCPPRLCPVSALLYLWRPPEFARRAPERLGREGSLVRQRAWSRNRQWEGWKRLVCNSGCTKETNEGIHPCMHLSVEGCVWHRGWDSDSNTTPCCGKHCSFLNLDGLSKPLDFTMSLRLKSVPILWTVKAVMFKFTL